MQFAAFVATGASLAEVLTATMIGLLEAAFQRLGVVRGVQLVGVVEVDIDVAGAVLRERPAGEVAIAHRLSTLRNATRLVVLKEGKVSEIGTHEELLAKKSEFHRLVQMQQEMNRIIEVPG